MPGERCVIRCAPFLNQSGLRIKHQTSTCKLNISTAIAAMTLEIIWSITSKARLSIILQHVELYMIRLKMQWGLILLIKMILPVLILMWKKDLLLQGKWDVNLLWSFGMQIIYKSKLSLHRNCRGILVMCLFLRVESMLLQVQWTINIKLLSMIFRRIHLLPLDKDQNLLFLPLNLTKVKIKLFVPVRRK